MFFVTATQSRIKMRDFFVTNLIEDVHQLSAFTEAKNQAVYQFMALGFMIKKLTKDLKKTALNFRTVFYVSQPTPTGGILHVHCTFCHNCQQVWLPPAG